MSVSVSTEPLPRGSLSDGETWQSGRDKTPQTGLSRPRQRPRRFPDSARFLLQNSRGESLVFGELKRGKEVAHAIDQIGWVRLFMSFKLEMLAVIELLRCAVGLNRDPCVCCGAGPLTPDGEGVEEMQCVRRNLLPITAG